MAATTRMVTWDEWVANGRYPAGSGSKGGQKFDPSDADLRSYYDSYVSQWEAGSDALRQQLNTNHGLSAWNAGGGSGEPEYPAWAGRHAPSTVESEVVAPAYTRPGLLDWSQYMPKQLGEGYMDPMALASQQGLVAGGGKYYRPWAEGALGNTGASNLWQYTPPTTSLFGWPTEAPALTMPQASLFTRPQDDDKKDDKKDDDYSGSDDTGANTGWTDPNTGRTIVY